MAKKKISKPDKLQEMEKRAQKPEGPGTNRGHGSNARLKAIVARRKKR